MKIKCPMIDPKKDFPIKFKNGILKGGKFIECDYQEFTPYSIDIPFDRDTKPVEVVDDYLNFLSQNDVNFRARLEEMLAHPLITERNTKRLLGQIFIIVGGGGNGKGTL